jgi:glycosyltransferase involved in cell wall biosynthesis
MKIGIFSKFDMAGGSERRCAEFANGLVRFSKAETFLLCERSLPAQIANVLDERVTVVEQVFASPKYLYDMNVIIVVNTDTEEFSQIDYWRGKSSRHNIALDLDKMKSPKKMFFLYNFIVSPSRHLRQLVDHGMDVGIITTNSKFFGEITSQDRYEDVRVLPRYILESPINPDGLKIRIRHSVEGAPVTFGMHSKRLGNKWNSEFDKLIGAINKRYGQDMVNFRFMGIKDDLAKKLSSIPNVKCMKEDVESVKDFLDSLDVFLFFPEWGREEPWARVIAEAMVSGLPVIALDKGGTKDQVLDHNNGFLCKKFNDYYKSMIYFMEHREMIAKMSRNSIRISKDFYTSAVIEKLKRMLVG